MKRALCIWLPHWPLQRLAATRGELKSRAVAIYELHASGSARVTAYCPHLGAAAASVWELAAWQLAAAQAGPVESAGSQRRPPAVRGAQEPGDRQSFSDRQRSSGRQGPSGIRAGMPLAEATALAAFATTGRGGQAPLALHLEPADPLADRTALARLAQWCQRFSPTVGVEEAALPESLLLDVTGLGPLFGGEAALADAVVQAFGVYGLTVRVALANSPSGAWALAHFAPLALAAADEPGEQAVLAALARPLVVPSAEVAAALGPLPVAALGLPPAVELLLHQLGLERIEQVAALPRDTLRARFGPLVLEKYDRASGRASEAIVAQAPAAALHFERLFEHPTSHRETIEQVLAELIEQACAALDRQRRGVLRLECRFELEGQPALPLVVGLYRPSAQAKHVCELVSLQLESRRFSAPVAAVGVHVLALDALEFHQQELFAATSQRESPRELATLIDRLSSRLGASAVVRPWLLAGAQPEFACQYRPLASLVARPKRSAAGPRRLARGKRAAADTKRGQPKSAANADGRQLPALLDPAETASAPAPAGAGPDAPVAERWQELVPGDRPLELEPRPRRLAVLSVAPEGPPVQFRLAGQEQRVVRWWGPERIETGWWRGRCVRRDYYQAETVGGDRYWLFRELSSGRWFLHGSFA